MNSWCDGQVHTGSMGQYQCDLAGQDTQVLFQAAEYETGVSARLLKAIAYGESLGSFYEDYTPRQFLEENHLNQYSLTGLVGRIALVKNVLKPSKIIWDQENNQAVLVAFGSDCELGSRANCAQAKKNYSYGMGLMALTVDQDYTQMALNCAKQAQSPTPSYEGCLIADTTMRQLAPGVVIPYGAGQPGIAEFDLTTHLAELILELDAGQQVPQTLKTEFQSRQRVLSADAQLEVKRPGREWQIEDHGAKYPIIKLGQGSSEKLRIFLTPAWWTSHWLNTRQRCSIVVQAEEGQEANYEWYHSDPFQIDLNVVNAMRDPYYNICIAAEMLKFKQTLYTNPDYTNQGVLLGRLLFDGSTYKNYCNPKRHITDFPFDPQNDFDWAILGSYYQVRSVAGFCPEGKPKSWQPIFMRMIDPNQLVSWGKLPGGAPDYSKANVLDWESSKYVESNALCNIYLGYMWALAGQNTTYDRKPPEPDHAADPLSPFKEAENFVNNRTASNLITLFPPPTAYPNYSFPATFNGCNDLKLEGQTKSSVVSNLKATFPSLLSAGSHLYFDGIITDTPTLAAGVQRSTASATGTSAFWTELFNIEIGGASSYEYDQRANPGQTTCYRAHAIDADGYDSGYSNSVCLTNPPESTYPYGIESVSTIPITPSYKNLPALFDGSTSFWAIVNYVSGEPVSVTLEFAERTTLSGFSIGLGGDANLPNAYGLTAVAAESLEELNAGSGPTSTYQTIVSNLPTPALEHVIVSFPHDYTARFFRFTAVRNEYSRHVHISELTPSLVTGTVGSIISGTLFANRTDPDDALANAYVQACTVGGVCYIGTTDNAGHYAVRGLKAGSYLVTAFPPADSTLLHERIGPLELSDNESLADQDLVLMAPTPPPTGTTITSRSTTTTGLPIVYWAEPLVLTTNGCVSGTATYSILQEGVTRRSGSLTEGEPGGTYTTTIEPLTPMHGEARIVITLNCPDSTVTTIRFDMYIDPSGTVMTADGTPIMGATVVLYRSENRHGPFDVVPNGSALMAPMNRHNPDTTDANGHFGWDVLAGYYKVRAEKLGCSSPDDPDQPYVESAVLSIPPAVTDLDLRLSCPDSVPPTITATLSPEPSASSWYNQDVTLTVNASDDEGGSGVRAITYSASGAQASDPVTVNGGTATLLITTEGQTTATYLATDNAGNSSAPQSMMVQLDKTAPTISITGPLSQVYNHAALLDLAWIVSDPLSGPGDSSGLLDGNVVTNGQTIDLLSLSLGAHTLTVAATDTAGNATQQAVTFMVTASIDSLGAAVQQACNSGAITRREACVALKSTVRIAQELIQHGRYRLARQVLRAFNVELLAFFKSRWIDQPTYELLKAEALFVINALPE
ncbi:hypothetical protein PLCT2_02312 [Planctomycetaceae bacterium]|nr:hypothetical protein PLCT2_02312 [Planctomycetaceae bacterium]